MTEPHLDKITKAFIEDIQLRNGKPLYEISPEEAREFLCNLQKEFHTAIDANTEDITIFSTIAGDISVRLVRPEKHTDEKLPVIVYCHGGGWVMGDADAFDMTIRTIAVHTKSVVAFINYPRCRRQRRRKYGCGSGN